MIRVRGRHFVLRGHTVDLLVELVTQELRARYKQSVLGSLWLFLSPLAVLLPIALIFEFVIRQEVFGVPYWLFLYPGLIPWLFFSESVRSALESVVGARGPIQSVRFPHLVLPLSMVGARAIEWGTFVVTSGTIIVWLFHLPVTPLDLLALIILFLLLVLLTTGVSVWFAALHAYFRDIRHLVQFAITLWMYLSPVVYAPEVLPERLQVLLALNPLTSIIGSLRTILFTSDLPPLPPLVLAAGVSALVCGMGYVVFRRLSRRFADVL